MIPQRCLLLRNSLGSMLKPQNKNEIILKLQRLFERTSHHSKRHRSFDHDENKFSSNLTTKDDEINEDDRKLQYIRLEHSYLFEQGVKVPDFNSIEKWHWDELVKLDSKSARKKYYKVLLLSEKRKERRKIEKEEKKRSYADLKETQAKESTVQNPHINYSLYNTSFLLRVQSGTMDLWRNNRLARAMQFGEKLIFDCSFDQHLTTQEANSTARQLILSFAKNRKHKDPFDLHFCNVENSNIVKQMERFIPAIRKMEFPLTLHEGSYLDLFPKEQLVYLTPHGRNRMADYNADSIYIIGAIADKGNQQKLSFAKAKEMGLKMERLPLDIYFNCGVGCKKSLSIDQVMTIMLDLKASKNRHKAK